MSKMAPEFVSFTTTAREFCAVIETLDSDQSETALPRTLIPLVATLIAQASQLPRIEPTGAEIPRTIDHDRWNEHFTRCATALGPLDLYWTNLDLTDPSDAQLSAGSLADDLADIWRDLRNGLDALDAGSDWRDVLFECHFSFTTHWGKHAVNALRPLHAALPANLIQP